MDKDGRKVSLEFKKRARTDVQSEVQSRVRLVSVGQRTGQLRRTKSTFMAGMEKAKQRLGLRASEPLIVDRVVDTSLDAEFVRLFGYVTSPLVDHSSFVVHRSKKSVVGFGNRYFVYRSDDEHKLAPLLMASRSLGSSVCVVSLFVRGWRYEIAALKSKAVWQTAVLDVHEPSGEVNRHAIVECDESKLMLDTFWSLRLTIPADGRRRLGTKPSLPKQNEFKNAIKRQLFNTAGESEAADGKLFLRSVEPAEDSVSGEFWLDYGGRVGHCSAKNFQLALDGAVVLRFGKVCADAYLMELDNPLSLMQGFGCALTVFEGNHSTDWNLVVPH